MVVLGAFVALVDIPINVHIGLLSKKKKDKKSTHTSVPVAVRRPHLACHWYGTCQCSGVRPTWPFSPQERDCPAATSSHG